MTHTHTDRHHHGTPSETTAEVDPVCGMTVDPHDAAGSHVYQGETHYFCSRHCLEKFKANPERFVEAATLGRNASRAIPGPVSPPTNDASGKYTCPMHPEIVQEGPGTCPKCGMALEPMQPSAEEGPDPELKAMKRRFYVGAVLTVPIFAIAMAGLIPSERRV